MHSFSYFVGLCLLITQLSVNQSVLLKSFVDFGSRGAKITVEIDNDNVTITQQINDGSYIGTGFGATQMENTYAIISSDSTTVQERKLGDHESGDQLTASITVISDSYTDGVRTMICTRSLTPLNSDYYDFSTITQNGQIIDVIWATRNGEQFRKHSSKGTKEMKFEEPTTAPSNMPTPLPTDPTAVPTNNPTEPTLNPTAGPTNQPTAPTSIPSNIPSTNPSKVPTRQPTITFFPTNLPSTIPSAIPTDEPSNVPSVAPTMEPNLLGSVTISSSRDAKYSLEAIIKIFDDNTIIFRLSGPDEQWYGFGFGNTIMNNTYAIITSGNGTIEQWRLGFHEQGTELIDRAVDYNLKGNRVVDDIRTVELEANTDDIPFDISGIRTGDGLKYIMASSTDFNFGPDGHDFREFGIAGLPEESTTEEPRGTNEPRSDAVRYVGIGNVVMILSGLMILFGML